MTRANGIGLFLVVGSTFAVLAWMAASAAQGALGEMSDGRLIAAAASVALLVGALVRASRIGKGRGRDSTLPPPPERLTVEETQAQLGS